MHIAMLTSTGFDETNQPLIKEEIKASGHDYKEFRDLNAPLEELLDFDVIFDRSAITDDMFFISLDNMVSSNNENNLLLVNSPKATMNSYDKIRTHLNIGKYSPSTIIYDGTNFDEVAAAFVQEKYVVIKQPRGWQAIGTRRLLFSELSPEVLSEVPVLVQKYVKPTEGIYRALVLCYGNKVEPIAWYTRLPQNHWRTGSSSTSRINLVTPKDSMIEFISNVALESGLFLNGIDYISIGDQHYLLEVNSVPRLSTSVHKFGINAPQQCIRAMEEALARR